MSQSLFVLGKTEKSPERVNFTHLARGWWLSEASAHELSSLLRSSRSAGWESTPTSWKVTEKEAQRCKYTPWYPDSWQSRRSLSTANIHANTPKKGKGFINPIKVEAHLNLQMYTLGNKLLKSRVPQHLTKTWRLVFACRAQAAHREKHANVQMHASTGLGPAHQPEMSILEQKPWQPLALYRCFQVSIGGPRKTSFSLDPCLSISTLHFCLCLFGTAAEHMFNKERAHEGIPSTRRLRDCRTNSQHMWVNKTQTMCLGIGESPVCMFLWVWMWVCVYKCICGTTHLVCISMG